MNKRTLATLHIEITQEDSDPQEVLGLNGKIHGDGTKLAHGLAHLMRTNETIREVLTHALSHIIKGDETGVEVEEEEEKKQDVTIN